MGEWVRGATRLYDQEPCEGFELVHEYDDMVVESMVDGDGIRTTHVHICTGMIMVTTTPPGVCSMRVSEDASDWTNISWRRKIDGASRK